MKSLKPASCGCICLLSVTVHLFFVIFLPNSLAKESSINNSTTLSADSAVSDWIDLCLAPDGQVNGVIADRHSNSVVSEEALPYVLKALMKELNATLHWQAENSIIFVSTGVRERYCVLFVSDVPLIEILQAYSKLRPNEALFGVTKNGDDRHVFWRKLTLNGIKIPVYYCIKAIGPIVGLTASYHRAC